MQHGNVRDQIRSQAEFSDIRQSWHREMKDIPSKRELCWVSLEDMVRLLDGNPDDEMPAARSSARRPSSEFLRAGHLGCLGEGDPTGVPGKVADEIEKRFRRMARFTRAFNRTSRFVGMSIRLSMRPDDIWESMPQAYRRWCEGTWDMACRFGSPRALDRWLGQVGRRLSQFCPTLFDSLHMWRPSGASVMFLLGALARFGPKKPRRAAIVGASLMALVYGRPEVSQEMLRHLATSRRAMSYQAALKRLVYIRSRIDQGDQSFWVHAKVRRLIRLFGTECWIVHNPDLWEADLSALECDAGRVRNAIRALGDRISVSWCKTLAELARAFGLDPALRGASRHEESELRECITIANSGTDQEVVEMIRTRVLSEGAAVSEIREHMAWAGLGRWMQEQRS